MWHNWSRRKRWLVSLGAVHPTSRAAEWACGKTDPARRELLGSYLVTSLRVGLLRDEASLRQLRAATNAAAVREVMFRKPEQFRTARGTVGLRGRRSTRCVPQRREAGLRGRGSDRLSPRQWVNTMVGTATKCAATGAVRTPKLLPPPPQHAANPRTRTCARRKQRFQEKRLPNDLKTVKSPTSQSTNKPQCK